MSASKCRFFRSPRTAGEKRSNAIFASDRVSEAGIVRGRIRTRKTNSRLADILDDRMPAARFDRARGKPSYSAARKAAERARWPG